MRLSTQDKIEVLKAALKAPDLESLKRWVVGLVDAMDAVPDGKNDAPVPPFIPVAVRTVPAILRDSIREGIAEAGRGEAVDLGSFAQYGGNGTDPQ